MKPFTAVAVTLTTLALVGCGVHQTEAPPLTGPSGFALTLSVSALPDTINQDGASQSAIKVTAIGPDGQPVSALTLRIDMSVDGVPGDFGTLSARTIVTNTAGVATVVYIAPPSPPNDLFGTCQSLPGTCVSIVATATGTNFVTSNPQSVLIRLAPPGLILPLGSAPTPNFTTTPSSPAANSPAQFDASSSCGGPLTSSGACPGTRSIAQYSWNFGDGTTGTGLTASHSFALSQAYTVTLTVTNDLGASASKPQVVTVGAGLLPTPSFTTSPDAPVVGELIFFNALGSTAGQGHTIASYRWNFGDGLSGSGSNVSHAFAAAGTYKVQLTVTDEAGQSVTSPGTSVTVGSGNPVAVLTLTKAGGLLVVGDGSTSSATGGATITKYTFFWGDGTSTDSGSLPATSHTYVLLGTYTVTLRVTDSLGRTGTSALQTVTVP